MCVSRCVYNQIPRNSCLLPLFVFVVPFLVKSEMMLVLSAILALRFSFFIPSGPFVDIYGH